MAARNKLKTKKPDDIRRQVMRKCIDTILNAPIPEISTTYDGRKLVQVDINGESWCPLYVEEEQKALMIYDGRHYVELTPDQFVKRFQIVEGR